MSKTPGLNQSWPLLPSWIPLLNDPVSLRFINVIYVMKIIKCVSPISKISLSSRHIFPLSIQYPGYRLKLWLSPVKKLYPMFRSWPWSRCIWGMVSKEVIGLNSSQNRTLVWWDPREFADFHSSQDLIGWAYTAREKALSTSKKAFLINQIHQKLQNIKSKFLVSTHPNYGGFLWKPKSFRITPFDCLEIIVKSQHVQN